MAKNKFCELKNLRNESDVEQFFVSRLLSDLGYSDKNILTKASIPKHLIGKGAKKKQHKPDYAIRIGKLWRAIIEVKHPDLDIFDFTQEGQDYATIHNRGYIGKDPVQHVLVTNGRTTVLLLPNQNKPLIQLRFEDFSDGSKLYKQLKDIFSADSISKDGPVDETTVFEFRKPEIDELIGIFQQCHQLIWKKHKVPPKVAFYEFTKLLFIKINEDSNIHQRIAKGQKITRDDIFFSEYQIAKQENIGSENPVNQRFIQYRDDLNEQVKKKSKKRIFEDDEKLKLRPSTIKEIVRKLETLDLKSVEDDINGKVFETFLAATVRGKELGQFFTPRSVVKFMVQMANLQISFDEHREEYVTPKILDACCGSGGFLIFALSDLLKKGARLPADQDVLKKEIKNNSLYGIDASEDRIVQIARMNMYIHGDGGSHIYNLDALDKDLHIEHGIDRELADEKQELKELLERMQFDVILTNPPFSMKYSKSDDEDTRILEQYELATLGKGKLKSLKSNVMFFERYHDILKDGGKLITVIDESVLNADGQGDEYRNFRSWLREKFIVKAVISLPKNTFVNADTGVKTSILYLIKRSSNVEEQPNVFMALSENVGHTDSGRSIPEMNDLPQILEDYRKFERGE